MFTFQEEKLTYELFEEAMAILYKHWLELANHLDDRPLEIDYDLYIQLNQMGRIRIFTVRDNGKLIGYFSFLIAHNLHYKSWMYASSDIYYLDPSYRKQGVAEQMFEAMEEWLRSLGIRSVLIQEKVNHPHVGLFNNFGFTQVENVYEKVIG